MAMRLHLRAAMIVACAVLALVCNVARAQEVPLVTGEHWTKASEEQKKAYLVGIANVILIETAFHAANPPADTQTILPRIAAISGGSGVDGRGDRRRRRRRRRQHQGQQAAVTVSPRRA